VGECGCGVWCWVGALEDYSPLAVRHCRGNVCHHVEQIRQGIEPFQHTDEVAYWREGHTLAQSCRHTHTHTHPHTHTDTRQHTHKVTHSRERHTLQQPCTHTHPHTHSHTHLHTHTHSPTHPHT